MLSNSFQKFASAKGIGHELSSAQVKNPSDASSSIAGRLIKKEQNKTKTLETALSKEEFKQLNESKSHIIASFRESERKRSRAVIGIDDPNVSCLFMSIRAPSTDEYAEMSKQLTEQLHKFDRNSSAYHSVYDEFNRVLNEFANFPKPVKVLALLAQSDEEKKSAGPARFIKDTFFAEYFVKTEDEINPEKGIPLEPETRRDLNWNGKSSWAKNRYGYLINLEEDATDKSSNSGNIK